MSQSPSENFSKYSIADFLKELGSDSVSPGGGSAAALTGAIGTSLVEMVSRINEKREQKKLSLRRVSSSFRDKITKLIKIRTRLGNLMKQDTDAFLKLASFSEDDRNSLAYKQARKTATQVPLETCRLINQATLLAKTEINRTSRWLASDLIEASILLKAAFRSARLNVEINLKSMSDRVFVNKIFKELNGLEKQVIKITAELSKVSNK